MSNALPRFVTVADAAAALSVSDDKIRDLIASDQLQACDVSLHRGGRARWRIAISDLEAFLAGRRTSPKPPMPRRKRAGTYQRKYYT